MGLIKTYQNIIQFFAAIVITVLLSSCGKSGASGELVGVGASNFRSNEVPYGMVYIPSGTFVMGQTDQDVTFGQLAQNKQVSVSAFFMDETEITNSEYRQFVNWVRDSIAITDYLKDDKFFIKSKKLPKKALKVLYKTKIVIGGLPNQQGWAVTDGITNEIRFKNVFWFTFNCHPIGSKMNNLFCHFKNYILSMTYNNDSHI